MNRPESEDDQQNTTKSQISDILFAFTLTSRVNTTSHMAVSAMYSNTFNLFGLTNVLFRVVALLLYVLSQNLPLLSGI